MNTSGSMQAYIRVIGSSERSIILPEDFTKKPAIAQEKELLNICRRHYSENGGSDGRLSGKIKAYRFYFSNKDFLDYGIAEIEAGW